ncbi:hypothetical protein [Mucilaginibacter sp.]|uniref:hypothetical protein n=1 Tax=Mucilaginibacter sp. TaxID=1882438 RepID=UPI0025CEFFE9|nr:hypothetical protein [Mucilaginibacter sp.]
MKISFFGFCIAGLLVNCFSAKAQTQMLNDNQGKPVMEQNYIDVEGSPYLVPNWFPGKVSLVSGKTMLAKLKYDLIKDELLFQSPRDSLALAFVEPVRSFSFDTFGILESNLLPLVFSSGYPAVDEQTPASFYQVIADGKVKVLKRYKKIIHSDQVFNSATVTKTFALKDAVYYLLMNDNIARIKPGSKVILTALNDKAEKMQTYIKSAKVDYKSDTDLAKLFNYYNSL